MISGVLEEGEDIMLSEISQTLKDKYCMISLNTWNLQKQNKQNSKRQTDSQIQRTEYWLPMGRR